MAEFRYTAIDASGKRIRKTTQATTQAELTKSLTANKMVIVEIENLSQGKTKTRTTLKVTEKIFFTQNIAVLLSSGISLGESMSIIANDTAHKSTSDFYESIRVDLEQGLALSQALAKYPHVFDSVYTSLVEAGENSGELASVMGSLAKGLEKDARTVHQVKSAMMYPAVVLASLLGLGLVIIFFVLPKITQVFEQLKVELPFMTRLLVSFSKLVTNYPLVILGAIILLGVFSYLMVRWTPTRQYLIHTFLRLPVIRDVIRNLDLTRLSSTLALLLNAGVPIQSALKIASGTITNPKLSEEFQAISSKLAAGVALGQALQQTSLPKTFIALVSVGERSGNIASIFATLSEHYEELFDTSVKNFTSILEPMLTLMVGVVVGVVVITIMLPIYQFVGNLQAVQ